MMVLAFLFGVICGWGSLFVVLGNWADSQAGRRRLALHCAEDRVRRAQTVALNRMASAAEQAVFAQTTGQAISQWPSEAPGDSNVVVRGED